MAWRRSQRLKNAAARGPSWPPPAAWNTSACVSVTAASGSATAPLPPAAGRIAGRPFLCDQSTLQRRFVHGADDCVGALEPRVGRIDVDRAHHRSRRPDPAGLTSGRDQLIEQLAHAAQAGRASPSLEPREIIRVERYRDRLFRHSMFIRYSLNPMTRQPSWPAADRRRIRRQLYDAAGPCRGLFPPGGGGWGGGAAA